MAQVMQGSKSVNLHYTAKRLWTPTYYVHVCLGIGDLVPFAGIITFTPLGRLSTSFGSMVGVGGGGGVFLQPQVRSGTGVGCRGWDEIQHCSSSHKVFSGAEDRDDTRVLLLQSRQTISSMALA